MGLGVEHAMVVSCSSFPGIDLLPLDATAHTLAQLDVRTLCACRLVCSAWASVALREDVLLAAMRVSRTITGMQLLRLLPLLTSADLVSLPRRPSITARGRTYWRYGPKAVSAGLSIVRQGGRAARKPSVPVLKNRGGVYRVGGLQ